MKKLAKPVVHFDVPVYPGRLFICNSIQDAQKYFTHIDFSMYGQDFGAVTIGGFSKDGSLAVIIVFNTIDDAEFHYISHESIHAAWIILENAGVKLDANNHEALTYLSDWVVKEVLRIKEIRAKNH